MWTFERKKTQCPIRYIEADRKVKSQQQTNQITNQLYSNIYVYALIIFDSMINYTCKWSIFVENCVLLWLFVWSSLYFDVCACLSISLSIRAVVSRALMSFFSVCFSISFRFDSIRLEIRSFVTYCCCIYILLVLCLPLPNAGPIDSSSLVLCPHPMSDHRICRSILFILLSFSTQKCRLLIFGFAQ